MPYLQHHAQVRPRAYRHRTWANIWCNSCQDTLPAHRWQCPCGLSWRSCPRHAQWASLSRLIFSKRIMHHRLERRANRDASDSASLLRQVHISRAQCSFSLRSASITTSTYPCQESVTESRKREAPEVLEHILLNCPKLFSRFPHLAAGR